MVVDVLIGIFCGDGCVCYGVLFFCLKIIEWNVSFFKCGFMCYKVIEQDLLGEYLYVLFKIEDYCKCCGLVVIEVLWYSEFFWSVKGYQIVEVYQKCEEFGWKDFVDFVCQVVLCGMCKEQCS